MYKDISRGLIILGALLAAGLSIAALIISIQAKKISYSRESISVKGLAEKQVKSDYAEWSVGIKVYAPTFSESLNSLRSHNKELIQFLANQGLDKNIVRKESERVNPFYVDEENERGQIRAVQRGFEASQIFIISTKDIERIDNAAKKIIDMQAHGSPIFHIEPLYLISNLENIKMSLIGTATQDARRRAEEFAKSGGAKVGTLRSASQGSFYIMADNVAGNVDDWQGIYDKTTVNKIVRVVVTVEYNIDR